MEQERNLAFDGFVTVERGVDSGRPPAALSRNQVAFAINTTFRGGYPTTRPGFVKRVMRFPNANGADDSTLRLAFQDGQFQEATAYDGGPDRQLLLASIGGNLYRIEPLRDFRVTDLTPDGGNSSTLTKAWFCQAEEFAILQDGQSKAMVYDGGNVRRLTEGELPVGTAMTYANGRVWIALPNGFAFVAGDLVYGDTGTPLYGYRDAVLKFVESTFLAEGGAFAVPSTSGGIQAIIPTTNLDTALGQGPILVLTPNLVCSVQAPINRVTWQTLQYPIQTVALDGYGAISGRSVITVNGDVFYRAPDGIRSFRLARRDFSQWGNTPVSAEMNAVLASDAQTFLSHASSVVFDNRLLSTVGPFWVQSHGMAHRGLAVLDFDILSRMHAAQQPAWEGVWTGLAVLQLVKGRFNGEERAFAFVLNGASQIELWEITKDAAHDEGVIGDTRIHWSIDMAGYDFQSPFALKRLYYGELSLDDLTGRIQVQARFRPDSHPQWTAWGGSWTEEATSGMSLAAGAMPSLKRRQHRMKKRLELPPDTIDTVEDRPLRDFFTLQPRLEFIGHARLRGFRVAAHPLQEFARGEYNT